MFNDSDIIKSYLSGMSQSATASVYGISQGTVSNVLARNNIPARTLAEAANRKDKFNTDFLDQIDTPEKAYWLGFITADGNVNDGTLSIRLNRQDAPHLAKFLQHIESSSHIIFSANNLGADCATIKIYSTKLSAALASHGIKGNKTWTVPPWLGPNELLCHYWRGIVDGDGWISTVSNGKNKNFFTVGLCGNLGIVTGFREYVYQYTGFATKIVHRQLESGNIFGQIAYTGTFRASDICKLLQYDQDYISLERKRLEAIIIMNHEPNEKKRNFNLSTESVLHILADDATGNYTQADLAKKYNVGKGTIYNIINRKGRFSSLTLP